MAPSLLLAGLCLMCGSTAAASQNTTGFEAVGQKAIDSTTQTKDLEFRNDGYQRMTVPVRLSGTGPYHFLVDTGADRSAISRELAARLKLPAGRQASLHTPAGISTIATANVTSLQFTGDRVDISDAALLDSEHMGADGILGTDTLAAQRVMFDFDRKIMSIVPSAKRENYEKGAIVVQARRRNGRLIISEARADQHRATIILDTGAQITIGNQALRRKLLGSRQVNPASQMQLVTVAGENLAGELAYIDKVEVGGVVIKNLAIIFTDTQTFRTLKLDRKPAMLLGMNAMRAFKKISIDFAARKLRVVLPEQSSLDLRVAAVKPNART